MWTYLIGPLLTLLPLRWRARWVADRPVNWAAAGLISGILEFVASFALLGAWYVQGMHRYIGALVDSAANAPKGVAAGLHEIQGMALTVFVLHPLTWTLCYFCFEGAIRTLAALAAEQAPGSLPLVLIDRVLTPSQRRREPYDAEDVARGERGFFRVVWAELRKRYRIQRAPLAADEVRSTMGRDGAGLQICSCRSKPTWTPGKLVRYADAFYRVESSRMDDSPRPFVFELKRMPAGVPSRSVHLYSPDEPLRARN